MGDLQDADRAGNRGRAVSHLARAGECFCESDDIDTVVARYERVVELGQEGTVTDGLPHGGMGIRINFGRLAPDDDRPGVDVV